jgi:hypothetical protein
VTRIIILAVTWLFFQSLLIAQDAALGLPTRQATQSRVYFAHDADAIHRFEENPVVVRRMVDDLVLAVASKPSVAEAWSSLVKPRDRIGIKISVTGGKLFSTHRGIVDAIVAGLQSAGHPRGSIVVWDREDPRTAGYRSRPGDYRLKFIEPVGGYDSQAVVSAPVLGKLIWGDLSFRRLAIEKSSKVIPETESFSSESHLARIVSRDVDKIINVPVMSEAESIGVAGCLYNMTIPNIDNWRRFAQSESLGDSYLGELYQDEQIAPKVVLHIMDGLIAQFAGGPDFSPQYARHHGTIYVSRDPVAVDATALRLFEKWRAEALLPRIGRRASYLESAAELGIGNYAAERIDLQPVRR